MNRLTVSIVIEREDDPAAGYSAFCPTLPGCFANGHTSEEAKNNMQNAIIQHLRALLANGNVVPMERDAIRVEELSFLLPT